MTFNFLKRFWRINVFSRKITINKYYLIPTITIFSENFNDTNCGYSSIDIIWLRSIINIEIENVLVSKT